MKKREGLKIGHWYQLDYLIFEIKTIWFSGFLKDPVSLAKTPGCLPSLTVESFLIFQTIDILSLHYILDLSLTVLDLLYICLCMWTFEKFYLFTYLFFSCVSGWPGQPSFYSFSFLLLRNLFTGFKPSCSIQHLTSSSSSYRAGSTDIPDPLSPLLPIVHRPR